MIEKPAVVARKTARSIVDESHEPSDGEPSSNLSHWGQARATSRLAIGAIVATGRTRSACYSAIFQIFGLRGGQCILRASGMSRGPRRATGKPSRAALASCLARVHRCLIDRRHLAILTVHLSSAAGGGCAVGAGFCPFRRRRSWRVWQTRRCGLRRRCSRPRRLRILDTLELRLTVVDRDTIDELAAHTDGPDREAFALCTRCGSACWRCGRPADGSTPI